MQTAQGTDGELYQEEMIAWIQEVNRRSGYYATRYKQMINRYGAVEAAKRQLRKHISGGVDGGRRLTDLGLDQFSVEWSVLDPRWEELFNREDRALAYAAMGAILSECGDRARH